MKKIHFLSKLILVLSVFLISACHEAMPIENSLAYAKRDNLWNAFRKYFIHNIQMIASSDESDNSHVIIISEPPEWVTADEVQTFLEDYNASFEIKKTKIGYDGWLKDILITVNDLDKEDYEKFTNKLNGLVYRSSYKPFIIGIPSNDALINPYLSEDINLNVTGTELKKWFVEEKEELFKEGDDVKNNIEEIFAGNKEGIFYSSKPGFVVWSLKQGQDISERYDDIRRFSLDADIILGAVSGNGMICIVGRERQEDILSLPPLRTETVQLLASADREQIAQSYERNSFFAGKLTGGKDWAPIYLSQELKNTEYGSLLNTTDQMLKSWSENGNISYVDFDYPQPDHWAFRDGVIRDMEIDQLTYNWNTTASVYSMEYEGVDYIAIDKLGALPVTYLPEGVSQTGHVGEFETMAHNFFSMLNNRDLIRANQYAILYQIFKSYGITATVNSLYSTSKEDVIVEPIPYNELNAVGTEIKNALEQISELTEEELNIKAEQLASRSVKPDSAFIEILYGPEGVEELKTYTAEKLKRSIDSLKDLLHDCSHHCASS